MVTKSYKKLQKVTKSYKKLQKLRKYNIFKIKYYFKNLYAYFAKTILLISFYIVYIRIKTGYSYTCYARDIVLTPNAL